MVNFFIKNSNIASVNPSFDARSLIPFSIADEEGVLIDETAIRDFFQQSLSREKNKVPSPFEGVYIMTIEKDPSASPAPTPVTVATPSMVVPPPPPSAADATVAVVVPAADPKSIGKVQSWDGSETIKTMVGKAADKIAKAIGKNVNVYVPHGCSVTLPKKQSFIGIYIWSCLNEKEIQIDTISEVMWGKPVEVRDGIKVPITGIKIESPEGDVVGEIINNNVFIFFDMAHGESSTSQYIVNKIMELIEEYYTTGKMTKEDLTEIYKAEFVNACIARKSETMKKLEREYSDTQAKVNELQAILTEWISKNLSSSSILYAYKSMNDVYFKKKYEEAYIAVQKIKRVRSIKLVSNKLMFLVDNITCTDPRTGELHDIGDFKVTVDLSNSQIKMENTKRTTRAYADTSHAPHVHGEAKPCLGSAAEVIPGLVAAMEFEPLVSYLITFLESVNVDDTAGSKIYKWPIVGETEEKYKKRMEISKQRETSGNTPWFRVDKTSDEVKVDAEWASAKRGK